MSKPLILVTGAIGKTGANVAEQLIERGFCVRALARNRDARSERLERLGAKVVLGDFMNLQSVRSAMKGASRVLFCCLDDGTLAEVGTSARERTARTDEQDAITTPSRAFCIAPP